MLFYALKVGRRKAKRTWPRGVRDKKKKKKATTFEKCCVQKKKHRFIISQTVCFGVGHKSWIIDLITVIPHHPCTFVLYSKSRGTHGPLPQYTIFFRNARLGASFTRNASASQRDFTPPPPSTRTPPTNLRDRPMVENAENGGPNVAHQQSQEHLSRQSRETFMPSSSDCGPRNPNTPRESNCPNTFPALLSPP